MSNLKQGNGDDHPDASGKHLADARVLLAATRSDGAAYLAGYVVECALKSLVQLETGKALRGHQLATLMAEVSAACMAAGAGTARYVTTHVQGVPTARIAVWRETLRYQSPSMTSRDAQIWVDEADQIYSDTVAAMILDGVIR
jgi:hypothetical protein